jgi:hypothetical protein
MTPQQSFFYLIFVNENQFILARRSFGGVNAKFICVNIRRCLWFTSGAGGDTRSTLDFRRINKQRNKVLTLILSPPPPNDSTTDVGLEMTSKADIESNLIELDSGSALTPSLAALEAAHFARSSEMLDDGEDMVVSGSCCNCW